MSDAARDDEASGPAIPTLAAFLEELLPPPGASVESRVPAGLRYTLVRARGGITAPPFQSLDEFSTSLARFERDDRRALLERLASSLVGAEQPAPPSTAHAPDSEQRVPVPRWDEVPLASVSQPGAAAVFHPAAGDVFGTASPEPASRNTRRPAGPILTTVAVLSMLMAAVVVGAAILVSLDHFAPIGRAVASWRATLARSAGQPSPEQRSPSASIARDSAPQLDAHAAPPANEPGTSGSIGTTSTNAAPSDAADTSATEDDGRPGEMIEALDVGNQPVFSPSFAADGSAVFFDGRGEAGSSSLKEARTAKGGRVVQVLSVVADGARNYHPKLSPDGSQVAFDSDRDGVRGVYVSDRAGHNIRRVSGAGCAAVPTWSPDGSGLAFVKAEPDKPRVWNVWTLTLATGEATRVTSYRYGQPWGASWLPDGRRLCYSHEDRLIVLDLETGESQTYASPLKGALLRTPAASPDGQRVIFQVHNDGAWMLDLANGKMRKVLDDPSAEEFAWSPDGTRVAFHSRRDRQWGIWVLQ